MAVFVGLGRSVVVRTVQVVRVDMRVVTAGVAVHLKARMNRPVCGQEDDGQSGRNGADASAQRLHPARCLPHHRCQSQQPNQKKGRAQPPPGMPPHRNASPFAAAGSFLYNRRRGR